MNPVEEFLLLKEAGVGSAVAGAAKRTKELVTGARVKRLTESAKNMDAVAGHHLGAIRTAHGEEHARHGRQIAANFLGSADARDAAKGEARKVMATRSAGTGLALGTIAVAAGSNKNRRRQESRESYQQARMQKAASDFFANLTDFNTDYAPNPVEEFLGKEASPGQHLAAGAKAFGKATLQGFGAAAASALVAGTVLGAGKAYQALTRERDFKSMMQANEDLHVLHQNDPKKFNLAFNSLRSMNSQFASDPFVAGAYMRQIVDAPSGGSLLAEKVFLPSLKAQLARNPHLERGSDAAASQLSASLFPRPQRSSNDRGDRRDIGPIDNG